MARYYKNSAINDCVIQFDKSFLQTLKTYKIPSVYISESMLLHNGDIKENKNKE